MMKLKDLHLIPDIATLGSLPQGKLLINTINAHSYNTARKDSLFAEALMKGDVLIPDGAAVVKACQWLGMSEAPRQRVAGWDLFVFEMNRLSRLATEEGIPRTVMFLGSSEKVLALIRQRIEKDYPMLTPVTYSPPFVKEFSEEQTQEMINSINSANPALLWIGMTAPKQEKWAYRNLSRMKVNCHIGTIGAVFDFYAGTSERAPLWWQQHGLEWLYRLLQDPRRMWRRYLIGNAKFILHVMSEKIR